MKKLVLYILCFENMRSLKKFNFQKTFKQLAVITIHIFHVSKNSTFCQNGSHFVFYAIGTEKSNKRIVIENREKIFKF